VRNLFIVGAQRSGSTYLYKILEDHPQVTMALPVRPEPKFFMTQESVAKGKTYYENKYYSDRKPDTAYLGEKSTSYIENIEAVRRIHNFYPNARLLMILRNPVLRAYSNYRFTVDNKLETMTFRDALNAETKRVKNADFSTSVSPFSYRQRGNYIDYINPFLEVFDSAQLRVIIFEEFVEDLMSVQDLYRWLGVTDDFVPHALEQVVNPAASEKEDQAEAFHDLALGYRESMARLEEFLGRELEVWRKHHRELCGADA
jgi:hypothetical protein